VVKGTTVIGYVDGVKVVEGTTLLTNAGRVGIRGGVASAARALASSFRASSGGVAFESFAAGVTEADGGIPQMVDPYFNSPTSWQMVSGASIANNQLNLPATGCLALSSLTGLVEGDTVEFRIYVAKHTPPARIVVLDDGWNEYYSADSGVGWHAGTLVLRTGFGDKLGMTLKTASTDNQVHFFFAWKAG